MMSPVLGANHEANPFNQLKTSLLFAVSGRRWSSADTVKRTALTELAFPVSASLPLGAPAHIPCVAQAGAGPGRRATREPAGRVWGSVARRSLVRVCTSRALLVSSVGANLSRAAPVSLSGAGECRGPSTSWRRCRRAPHGAPAGLGCPHVSSCRWLGV